MADVERRLLRVAAIRAIETAALARSSDGALMKRAGQAVARLAATMTLERAGDILVLAGPGNNGGDALVAACELHRRGLGVRVALLDERFRDRGDAATAWARWQEVAGDAAKPIDPLPALANAVLVIDGLFGIGSNRAPDGLARDWIVAVDDADVPVLAIDVPSGVNADTGCVEDVAIRADRTITFIADKPGLHTGAAVDHVGIVTVDGLGLGRETNPPFAPGDVGRINGPALFERWSEPRKRNSHKGSNGSIAMIGGDRGMVGAALMASRMALHAGAGRVYVKLVANGAPDYDVLHPELMLRDSLDGVEADAYAVGPGLGHGTEARELLAHAIDHAKSIVLDADALNMIAKDGDLASRVSARVSARVALRRAKDLAPAVLTPHPLEAARLLGSDVASVERDRIVAATTLALRFASVVVLKGAGTIVATPDGSWVVNTTGNPALGTGGTGDVLCGLVAGLLAQRLSPFEAACAAVWLHGSAADDLVAAGVGPVGLTASELIPAIRARINRSNA